MTVHQKRNSKKSHWKKKTRRTRDNNDGIVVGGADYKLEFQTLFSSTIQQITDVTDTDDIEKIMKAFIAEFIAIVNAYDKDDNNKTKIVTIYIVLGNIKINDINENFKINELLPNTNDIIENFVDILRVIKSKLPADKSCHSFIIDLFLEYINKSFDSSDRYYYEKDDKDDKDDLYEFGSSSSTKYNIISNSNYYDEYVQLYNNEEPDKITKQDETTTPLYIKSADDNKITNDIRIGRFLLHAFIKAALKVCGRVTYTSTTEAPVPVTEPETSSLQPTDKLDFRITFLRYLDLLEDTSTFERFQQKFPDYIFSDYTGNKSEMMESLQPFFANEKATAFIKQLNNYSFTKFAIVDAIKSVITTETEDGKVGINETILIKTQKEPALPITVSLNSESIANLQYLFENEKYNQLLAKDIIKYYTLLFSILKKAEELLNKPLEVEDTSKPQLAAEILPDMEFDLLKYKLIPKTKYNRYTILKNKPVLTELETLELRDLKANFKAIFPNFDKMYFDETLFDEMEGLTKSNNKIKITNPNIIHRQSINPTYIINSFPKRSAYRPIRPEQFLGFIRQKPIDTTQKVETSINHKELFKKLVNIMYESKVYVNSLDTYKSANDTAKRKILYDEITQRIPELFSLFSSSINAQLNNMFASVLIEYKEKDEKSNFYKKHIDTFFSVVELFENNIRLSILSAVDKIQGTDYSTVIKNANITRYMDQNISEPSEKPKISEKPEKLKNVNTLTSSIIDLYKLLYTKVFDVIGYRGTIFENELKTGTTLKQKLVYGNLADLINSKLSSEQVPLIDREIANKEISKNDTELSQFVSQNIPDNKVRSILEELVSKPTNLYAPQLHEIIGLTPVVNGTKITLDMENNSNKSDTNLGIENIQLKVEYNILLYCFYAYYSYHTLIESNTTIKIFEEIKKIQTELYHTISKIKLAIMENKSIDRSTFDSKSKDKDDATIKVVIKDKDKPLIKQAKETAVKLIIAKQIIFDLVNYVDYIKYYTTSENIVKPDSQPHTAEEQAKYKALYATIYTEISTTDKQQANDTDILSTMQSIIGQSNVSNPDALSIMNQIVQVVDEIVQSPSQP